MIRFWIISVVLALVGLSDAEAAVMTIPVTLPLRGRADRNFPVGSLFGLGGSGLASASALLAGGADVIGWDDDAAPSRKATSAGIPTADLRHIDWSRIAALVLAPGVPLTHPAPHWTVGLARAAAVEVIGDIELFCRERRASCARGAVRRHHRHQRQIDHHAR